MSHEAGEGGAGSRPNRVRVAVLFGGQSGEHDVSLRSAQTIIGALDPLFAAYAHGREPTERFGDFLIRSGIVAATSNGSDFHVNTGPLAEAAE